MVQLLESDLNEAQEIQFQHKSVVKFLITDFRENATNGNIILKVTVLSEEHKGAETEIFLTTKDNPASKKRRAQFFNAFINSGVWKKEDLISGAAELKALLGHAITVTSDLREHQGKSYQNWNDFQDCGLQTPPPAAGGAVSY